MTGWWASGEAGAIPRFVSHLDRRCATSSVPLSGEMPWSISPLWSEIAKDRQGVAAWLLKLHPGGGGGVKCGGNFAAYVYGLGGSS